MKKKGFTLIELLAVIVILAVIALIAVPVILKVIENSKKGAAKTSALNYMKAVETYLVASKLDKNAVKLKKGETYNCTENTIIGETNYLPVNDLVQIKGYKPTNDKDQITIDENYRVDAGKMTIGGYTVTVKDKEIASVVKGAHIDVEKLELNYTEQTMEKGSSFELKPIFTPKNASDQRVTYSSSDESIVTVSENGIVTAKKNGNAKITVTSKDKKDKKAECNITVVTSATGVTIEPSSKEIEIGKTVQLVGTIEPNDVTTNALSWSSSDVSIAHVDENGLVTGMSVGTATITASTVNGKEATSTITVKEIVATSVSLNQTSATIGPNTTLQLSATITPSNTANKTLTWTSSNTSVATVSSSGLVTGKAVGSATITVKTSNNKSATSTITVSNPTGIASKTYSKNQTVTYQGISFQVVKDNGSTVTLVTASDVGTGAYGSSTTFNGSTAYNYVNTTWVNANSGIKEEIKLGGIITDTTTNSKVRLLTKDEVSGKTNGTGRPFWTMTSSGSGLYYAKSNGVLGYNYVSGSDIASSSTVVAPTASTARVDDTYTTKCRVPACCRKGTCSDDGICDIDICIYTLTNTNYKPLGYRPVITVMEK